jgi:predicted DNA-binding protein (UPF0251 family)
LRELEAARLIQSTGFMFGEAGFEAGACRTTIAELQQLQRDPHS